MFRKRILRIAVLFLFSLAVCVSPAAGQDGAWPEGDLSSAPPQDGYDPVPGGPGFLMVPASSFIPKTSSTLYQRFNGATLETLPGSPSNYYYAPVMLPQGAKVNKIVIYFEENDQVNDASLHLFRVVLPGAQQHPITVAYSGYTGRFAESYMLFETNPVDNQLNAYYFILELPPPANSSYTMRFNGARIDYGFNSALPAINR